MAANVRLLSIDYDHHGSFLTSNSRSSTLPARILTRLLAISSAFNDMFLISGSGAMTITDIRWLVNQHSPNQRRWPLPMLGSWIDQGSEKKSYSPSRPTPSVLYKSTQKGLFKGFVGRSKNTDKTRHWYANPHKEISEPLRKRATVTTKKQRLGIWGNLPLKRYIWLVFGNS